MADTFLFIDTEFTSFKEPELISICLAKDEADFIYLEARYSLSKCSEFVVSNVLPLLSGPPIPIIEVAQQAAQYIKKCSLTSPVYIVGDYSGDWNIFLELMKPLGDKKELGIQGFINIYSYLGYMIHQDVVNDEIARSALSNIVIIYKESQKAWFKNNEKAEHHAKSDALANRYAFRQCVRYIKSISVKT